MSATNLTERQQKWFATVRAGLERDTGKTMDEWVAIARSCPETGHRARLKWLKENHGLLMNRASLVLSEAFDPDKGWGDPEKLVDELWADPASRAIFEAVDAATATLPGTTRTARKSYTAWSRKVQYAALRPIKGGKAMFGLAVGPAGKRPLETPKNESWSERLTARTLLTSPADVDGDIHALMRAAWERA
jgi:hypothetical protein